VVDLIYNQEETYTIPVFEIYIFFWFILRVINRFSKPKIDAKRIKSLGMSGFTPFVSKLTITMLETFIISDAVHHQPQELYPLKMGYNLNMNWFLWIESCECGGASNYCEYKTAYTPCTQLFGIPTGADA
jgi:hypothetical protein